MKNRFIRFVTVFLLLLSLLFSQAEILIEDGIAIDDENNLLVEYGYDYSNAEDVAFYLFAFHELPPNYITKNEAYDLGWNPSSGNLNKVAPDMLIGGDKFGNREKVLPVKKGVFYIECDVNYNSEENNGYRGAERLVFSCDGCIYYTGDHYNTFDLMYDHWFEEDFIWQLP